jgi:radical SAM protein with 4Fe4S-binding SPASM domain
MFISVISSSNEDTILTTVNLAKELNTVAKINRMVKSGKAESYYPLYKIINSYLDIIENGLTEWESNSQEIIKLYNNLPTICPYNRNCYAHIRAINPDGLIHSCGSVNDDHYINLHMGNDTYELSTHSCDKFARDNLFIKHECLSCDTFVLCNSCYKFISEIKCDDIHKQNDHCVEMKKNWKRLRSLLS